MSSDRATDPRVTATERPHVTADDCGHSAAARTWRPLVEPGMYVAGVAGDLIGQVKEVRAGDFLVDRSGSLGLGRDTPLYLPFDRIHVMMGDRITLDVASSQVEEHGSVPGPLGL